MIFSMKNRLIKAIAIWSPPKISSYCSCAAQGVHLIPSQDGNWIFPEKIIKVLWIVLSSMPITLVFIEFVRKMIYYRMQKSLYWYWFQKSFAFLCIKLTFYNESILVDSVCKGLYFLRLYCIYPSQLFHPANKQKAGTRSLQILRLTIFHDSLLFHFVHIKTPFFRFTTSLNAFMKSLIIIRKVIEINEKLMEKKK